MSQISRQQLIDLYNKACFQDNFSKGEIMVDSAESVENLRLAFSSDHSGWSQIGTEAIMQNQTYRFYHRLPRSVDFGHIFNDIDQFCRNSFFKSRNSKKYFIIDLKFDSNNPDKPQIIKNYEALLRLLNLLATSAAFVDSSFSRFLFLQPEKMELEVYYSSSNLANLNIEIINQLESYICENIHQSQKRAIFSKAIVNHCKHAAVAETRFELFLTKLKPIFKSLDHDYAVFSSDFSYEKLRNEIENAKLEEQVKIHKILSDIQNQILGIPIATVIVATQFKTQQQVDYHGLYQFCLNTAIFIGVLIFVVILWMLIKNQNQSLLGLEIEIIRKDRKFKIDSPIVYEKIESEGKPPFEDVFHRIKSQKRVLNMISSIAVVGLVITLFIYCAITINPIFLF